MNTLIEKVEARQILDSRGFPTVEVDVLLQGGIRGTAAVPSGLSLGSSEAHELRDGIRTFYAGKSVWQAVHHVNKTISEALHGRDAREQRKIDETMLELDGTHDKHKLGANAILGVSLACARAASAASKLPLFQYLGGLFAFQLPVPMVNVLNGGVHADTNQIFQEFLIVPQKFRSFSDSLRCVCETFYALKNILKENGLSTNYGDEGGFAPEIQEPELAFEILERAVRKAGYQPGEQVKIAFDAAANSFYRDGKYHIQGESYTSKELAFLYEKWCRKYPICSIEDGLAENDWDGWSFLTELLGDSVLLVGDDLFCTNTELLENGFRNRAANAVIIKPNQVGTLSETFDAIQLAKKNGFQTVISHRSGETNDAFIADLSVAVQADFIKSGSVARTERSAKYNQLLRIEQRLSQNSFTVLEKGTDLGEVRTK